MAPNREIEVKFRVNSPAQLLQRLRQAGFRQITPRTHEMNAVYDLPEGRLRKRGELLRLRKYGADWTLTHKAKGKAGRHKIRIENETKVADGARMDSILRALSFAPSFHYEKFRAEWSDGKGHVVIDETPIGNFAEIEGPAHWIDRTAVGLQVQPRDYVTATYAELFFQWKKQTRSSASDMTFRAVNQSPRRRRQRNDRLSA